MSVPQIIPNIIRGSSDHPSMKTYNQHTCNYQQNSLSSFTEGSDYRFLAASTNTLPAEWTLDIQDDDIALEYDDHLILTYSPLPFNLTDRFKADGQFVRSTAAVYIEDNDGKTNMLAIMFCIQRVYSKIMEVLGLNLCGPCIPIVISMRVLIHYWEFLA